MTGQGNLRLRGVAGGLAVQCVPVNGAPGTNTRGSPPARGTHVCAGLESRVRAPFCGRGGGGGWRRRTQVQQAPRAGIWGPRGPGAGRAHLRVVQQPQLVEPLRGGHGLTRLWPCCAPPVAASSEPPAGCPGPGPWAGGRHSGAERLGTAGGSPRLPTPSRSVTKVYTPLLLPGQPATAWLPTLCSLSRRRPPPRLSQDCAKGGVSCWGEEPEVRAAREVAQSHAPRRQSPLRASGRSLASLPGIGGGEGLPGLSILVCIIYQAWDYRYSRKGLRFARDD